MCDADGVVSYVSLGWRGDGSAGERVYVSWCCDLEIVISLIYVSLTEVME